MPLFLKKKKPSKSNTTCHPYTYHFDLLGRGVTLYPLGLPELADNVSVASNDDDVGYNLQEDCLGPEKKGNVFYKNTSNPERADGFLPHHVPFTVKSVFPQFRGNYVVPSLVYLEFEELWQVVDDSPHREGREEILSADLLRPSLGAAEGIESLEIDGDGCVD